MKIKIKIFIIIFISSIFLMILIFKIINKEQAVINYDKNTQIRKFDESPKSDNKDTIIINEDDETEEEIDLDFLKETKEKNVDNIIHKTEIEFDNYYSSPNWVKKEVVLREERERLSLFDIIDGKKPRINRTTKTVYRWLMDLDDEYSYVVDKSLLIKIAAESEIAYKYYFDKDGYLITDNITKDFTIVDSFGREIDSELNPIEYHIGNSNFSIEDKEEVVDSKEDIYIENKNINLNQTIPNVIVTEGVVIRNKIEKIFNTLIDRDMTKHIVGGRGYRKNTKGKTFSNGLWLKALKLMGNESFIVFENSENNFNKVAGKVSMEHTISSNEGTRCKLVVYDKYLYDKGHIDEYLYNNDEFNYTDPIDIEFKFDRSIKNLVFVLYIDGKYTNRAIYFKDLKFGFSKKRYREEIDRKREEAEEIEYLKSLGLYVEEDDLFDIIDEDGDLIDEFDDKDDDYFDINEYYEKLIDKNSGPAFDKELIELANQKIGPYYEIISTTNEINDTKNKRKSKIIYTE